MGRNKLGLIAAVLAFAAAGALLLARLRAPAVETAAPPGPELAAPVSTIVTSKGPATVYTNDDLARRLQEETGRMGITGIAKPEDGEPSSGGGGFMGEQLGQPGTREQAETYIRQLAQMRRPFERDKDKTVKLPGDTAAVLGTKERGGAAIEADPGAEGPKKK